MFARGSEDVPLVGQASHIHSGDPWRLCDSAVPSRVATHLRVDFLSVVHRDGHHRAGLCLAEIGMLHGDPFSLEAFKLFIERPVPY